MNTINNFKQKSFFKSCMQEKISETLNKIGHLKTPVSRSCHLGNNTSNNWGFLALAQNAQLVQYEHTLHGIDENCAPWLVLADNGVITTCYDHNGVPVLEETGKHINIHLQNNNNKKYTRHLNYALFAKFNGMDLINHHYNIANKISNSVNGRNITFHTKELLSIEDRVRNIIETLAKTKRLDLLFSHWVKTTKKNYVMKYKIDKFHYQSNNIIQIYTKEGPNVFSGTIDNLCHCFFSNIQYVHDRIINVRPLETLNYPWMDLHFSYVLAAIKEFYIDKQQQDFWHAGGSASQYYTNAYNFKIKINELIEQLILHDYLPIETQVHLIPSFCCQLFATNQDSLIIIEEIVQSWLMYKNKNISLIENIVHLLSEVSHPLEVIKKSFQEIGVEIINVLKQLVVRFNKMDINKLPVAHITSYKHASYNKYGVAQDNLMGKKFLFPPSLYDLRWGEAELLVKILGEILINDYH